MSELAEWESFYVIVGAAAGALIGLQFVVLTLISDGKRLAGVTATTAFATPTIVHFSVALWLSVLLRVPWHTVTPVAALSGVTGAAGIVYAFAVISRMRRQSTYKPETQDWLLYAILPMLGYAVLLLPLFVDLRAALFAIAASALSLLFLGIRNAWDTVTYHVFQNRLAGEAERDQKK
jgi:hypothetical protein